MRCFLAINLPNEVKTYIDPFALKLKASLRRQNITWVRVGILHITMEFFGDIEDDRVEVASEVIESVLDRYRGRDIRVRLYVLEFFPSPRRPRVIVLMGRNASELNVSHVQRNVHNALLNKGFELDNKAWRPHVTLGRIKDHGARMNIDRLVFEPITFSLTSLDLMSSMLTLQGPEYTLMQRFTLL